MRGNHTLRFDPLLRFSDVSNLGKIYIQYMNPLRRYKSNGSMYVSGAPFVQETEDIPS